jgi:hypothetical protein
VFNKVFLEALKSVGYDDAGKWHRDNRELKKALNILELPGDVWNDSPVLREGLFKPYITNERKSWNMPKTIRNIYTYLTSNGMEVDFYPEQLDVTFDYVPRMCVRDMCNVCLFGSGVKKVCHRKAGLVCPVVLPLGYVYECSPTECRLIADKAKGLCKSQRRR